jgi:hypothetical protein
LWIKDEDQVVEAQAGLERFRADPEAEEFHNARSAAAKAREAELLREWDNPLRVVQAA